MKTLKISVIGKTGNERGDLEKLFIEIPYSKEKELSPNFAKLFPELKSNVLDFRVEKITYKYKVKVLAKDKIKYKTTEIKKLIKEFDDLLNNYIGE